MWTILKNITSQERKIEKGERRVKIRDRFQKLQIKKWVKN